VSSYVTVYFLARLFLAWFKNLSVSISISIDE